MPDSSEINGFPELSFEPRCTLCQMVHTHAGILKYIHREYAKDTPGDVALHSRIKPIFERHGISPCPSPRAFGRHVRSHVNLDQMGSMDAFDVPNPVEAVCDRFDETSMDLRRLDPADLALGHNDSDYHNMADLFRRIYRRIAALDSDPEAFRTPEGKHNFQRYRDWANMVSSAKSILEGLNKMRNTDRMTVSIIEQHTKRYATALVGPIGDVIRGVRDELFAIDHPKAQELSMRLSLLLDKDVPLIFRDAAVRTLKESKDKFKLLN